MLIIYIFLRKNKLDIAEHFFLFSEYAEFLEVNLKKMNMKVDLLFPNPDIPMNRVFGTLAQRGTLYVLVVRDENKLYRSVTVDILHGIPEGSIFF